MPLKGVLSREKNCRNTPKPKPNTGSSQRINLREVTNEIANVLHSLIEQ